MQFAKPTTKNQMYATLKEIFYYYRIKRVEYEDVQLKPLSLRRIEFTPLTDTELKSKAEKLVAREQAAQIRQRTREYEERANKLRKLAVEVDASAVKLVQSVTEEYKKAQEELLSKAEDIGLTNSTVLLEQISLLESEKTQKLSQIEQDRVNKQADIEAEIQEINYETAYVYTYFSSEHTKQETQKYLEIKDEQDKLIREIQKYNTSLDEKEQRYDNTILESNASLKLRYLQICAEGLTKDQLIEMGYYEDILECVCGYYDTLSPVDAFRDIANDPKIAVYLDDFYTQIVYMYQSRVSV